MKRLVEVALVAGGIYAGMTLAAGAADSTTTLTQFLQQLTAGLLVNGPAMAVGSLPTCNAGRQGFHAVVTDSNSTTFHATVAAGGANVVMVMCDGTNWVIG